MTHDSEANAAYIYLVEKIDRGEVARSCLADIAMDRAAITIDLDAEGRVLGIEVLGANRALGRRRRRFTKHGADEPGQSGLRGDPDQR